MTGQPIVSIDNLNGELGGDFLCQAVERPVVEARILGRSELVRIESRASIFATGNNLTVRGDMVRRVIRCSLDANCERPELRKFANDPLQTVLANRGRYIAAALVIVRAYIAAGSPNKLVPLASFRPWSDTVRSALVWLGCADPVDTIETSRSEDSQTITLREMFAAWKAAVGVKQAYFVRELIKAAKAQSTTKNFDGDDSPDFLEALRGVAGTASEISAIRLGKWLGQYKGKIIDGFKLTATEDSNTKINRWALSPQ